MPDLTTEIDDLYLGIDVGGTDVKIGLVDASGSLIDSHRTPTPPLGTPQRVFQFAIDHARQRLDELARPSNQLRAVGVAVPGVLDANDFVLREVVNLPSWLNVALADVLRQTTGLPSAVVNDANAAAYAEHERRKLGKQSLALVTLGTGVGSGVVFGGHPHGGDHGCAGELGHIAVDFSADALECSCGSRGHLESYVGAAGIVARFRRQIQSVDPASLPESLPDSLPESLPDSLQGETITPRDIAEAAENGHPICQNVINESARYLGRAIGMVGQVADPAVVLLGGAMTFGGDATKTGKQFIHTVRQSVAATTLVQVGGNIQIEYATLGNHAGMIGAAMVAKQSTV